MLGGGFAGLSAAIHLALAGREVILLEQQAHLGGKAGELQEQGYRFDTGPSVFTLPHIVEEIFTAAGEATPLTFHPLEPLCRYFYPSSRVWDVHLDHHKTTSQLTGAERKSYLALRDEARKLYDAAAPTFLYHPSPGLWQLAHYGLRHGLSAHPLETLPQLIDTFGASPELKQFFLRFATYFGADPHRAPAVLHNIAWVELGLGVYYPEGGIYAVVKALGELAHKLGVEVKTNTKVEQLELKANRISRVHSDRGAFSAEQVVSSLDIVRTHQLMGQRAPQATLEPSLSGFVLLLGLKGTTPELAHHNISFTQDYRREFTEVFSGKLPADPTLYLSLSCRSEPADAPKGCENWFVLANAPALPPDKQLSKDRECAYAEHLLNVLEQRGFPVRDRLHVMHILPPRHLATLAHRGSIYGAAPHSLLRTLRPKQTVSGVNNLFLAGGSVHPGGGVPLALLSGKYAASLALT